MSPNEPNTSLISIEWQHLDVEKNGEARTCMRCADTGEALGDLVAALGDECAPRGVEIRYRETKLPASEIARSNLILIDGVPIERLLPGASAATSGCASCGELIGEQAECRTVESQGRVYETIPAYLVRQAVCAVAQCCAPAQTHP